MSPKTRHYSHKCEICDYKSNKKSDLDKHFLTAKHINTYQILTKSRQISKENEIYFDYFECICGKKYKHKQSLNNHKKKCKAREEEEKGEIKKDILGKEKELIEILVKQNEKLLDTIKDQSGLINDLGSKVKSIGNNNTINSNNTNIIVMLNDKYKDALNLEDFVKSLTISLEDLNITKEEGIVKGITNAFVSNLKKLDKSKRPVYCLGKNDIIYIKDNEEWEQDKKNKKIKDSINKVAFEQRKAIDKWTEANPDYLLKDVKQEEYLKLVKNTTQGLENTEYEEKIVKNIVNIIAK